MQPPRDPTGSIPPTSIVPPPDTPRSARSAWIWIGLAIGIVAGNLVAYAVYSSMKKDAPIAVPPTEPAGSDGAAVARARRLAGLVALEQSDYDAAVAEFSAALRAGGGPTDLTELLQIAKGLQDRARRPSGVAPPAIEERTPPAPPPASPAKTPEPEPEPKVKPEPRPEKPRAVTRPAPRRSRPTPAARPTAEPEPEPAIDSEPKLGLLLVTTTPPRLLIEVDGKSVDLSPARVELSPGSHRVVIFGEGRRRLFERSVQVEAGGVATVNEEFEVSSPETALPPLPPAASPTPPASPREEAPTPPAAPREEPPKPAPPPEEAPKPAAVGEIQVVSPNVFGEIFVDGKSYGYPPRVIKALPAGTATVEIRVGGAVRRSQVVTIRPNERTRVRFQ
ncbi:MAG: hypothetical protein IT384_18240 [Deltaproteobacteria bacterium]|nr:hypothetical protein [Deltaproteobacteria bacterium]